MMVTPGRRVGGMPVSTGLRHWPRRRWLLAAAVFPVFVFMFAAAGGGLAAAAASWWIWPWLILIGALAGVVVASYLAPPGTGKIIDVGCSPCAVMAGLAVVGALLVHSNAPASPFMATVATVLTAFALRQRLTDATACATPRRAGPSSPPADGQPADGQPADGRPPAAPRSS